MHVRSLFTIPVLLGVAFLVLALTVPALTHAHLWVRWVAAVGALACFSLAFLLARRMPNPSAGGGDAGKAVATGGARATGGDGGDAGMNSGGRGGNAQASGRRSTATGGKGGRG